MGDFSIHGWLGSTSQLYFVILAGWGFWRFFRKQGVDSNYWGALVVGEVLIIAQVLIGVYLFFIAGLRPARNIHLLYGFLVPAIIPGIYFYTKGREDRAESLAYGTAILIAAGLIMRAIFTGEVVIP